MCGIAGHWAYSGRDLGVAEFRAFTNSLEHRGPDGCGFEHFPDDRLWLGHRRLSVLDVSQRGRQPMPYGRNRYWLSFNGEIYNFIELRETLRRLGHRFVSDTDSEVVLAAYAEWGAECQLRFNGMWAFVIWDTLKKQFFLSRDRFGVKPLFYADMDGCFSFASELRSFLHLPGIDGALDENVLAAAIQNVVGQECSPRTNLPGVRRLPGGHCMTVGRGGAQITSWWDTMDHLPEVPAQLNAQTSQFRDLFLDACRLRLRSDVSIATSLSGGLDSSAVACAISELGRRGAADPIPDDWQSAFVTCYPGTNLDEKSFAEQVVEHTRLRAHFLTVDVGLAAEEIEQVVYDLEDLWHVPMVGAWAIYREMRKRGVRVSLDGHGADELLGGYHFVVQAAIESQYGRGFRWRRYRDLTRVRSGLTGGTRVGGGGDLLGHTGLADDLRVWVKRVATNGFEKLGFPDRPNGQRTRRQSPRADSGSTASLLHPREETRDGAHPSERLCGRPGGTPMHGMLDQLFHQSVLPSFLRCIDRASMAHGIEVRMPFMDWRLVTLAFALPDESKIGGGYTKRILRLSMDGLMPDPIRLRTKKVHFSAPITRWARQGLGTWLADIADSRAFQESAIWNGKAARYAITQAVAGKTTIDAVWPIINAHLLQQHFKSERRRIVRKASNARLA